MKGVIVFDLAASLHCLEESESRLENREVIL